MFKILKIETEDHPLYHRTKATIDNLDEDFLLPETDWHNNGGMGLWCSTLPQMCSAFGENCYHVKLKDSARCFGISLGDLKSLAEVFFDRSDYQIVRQFCFDNGVDVLYVVDVYPRVGEVIVVNYSIVDSVVLVDAPEDKNYNLQVLM